jgi:hypothetical protein
MPLNGTGGLFQGGAKGTELAATALAEGLLTLKEERVKSGKGWKTLKSGVLTDKGIRRVVEADSPKAALEALLPPLQALGKQPDPPNPDTFRTELSKAAGECVSAIKEAFGKLEGDVLKALSQSRPVVDPAVVLNALRHALERVKAPVLPSLPSAPAGPGPTPPAPVVQMSPPSAVSPQALEEAMVRAVNAWAKEKTVGCQFDVLWKRLKDQHPDLTIGVFQDALRTLHNAGRLRLSGWPRMLDDMPQPELALFVSSKVMYHAHPAPANG